MQVGRPRASGAIRIDSGDLAAGPAGRAPSSTRSAPVGTRIMVTSDLDESPSPRSAAPVDRIGVGTQLVTGSGRPTAGLVYKLVAIADAPGADAPLRPVAKRSPGKATQGGVKLAGRRLDATGRAVGELVADARHRLALFRPRNRNLQAPYVRHGEAVRRTDLAEVREDHLAAKAELGRATSTSAPARRR